MRSWNTYIESWDVRQWINVAILGWMQTNVCTWSGLRATQLMYKFWGSNSEPPKNQLRTPTWGCKYWISPLKLWLYNPLISSGMIFPMTPSPWLVPGILPKFATVRRRKPKRVWSPKRLRVGLSLSLSKLCTQCVSVYIYTYTYILYR
jgi:hypothetical protein